MVSCSNQSFAVVILRVRISGVQFALGDFPFLASGCSVLVARWQPFVRLPSRVSRSPDAVFSCALGCGGVKVAAFCVKLEEKVPT